MHALLVAAVLAAIDPSASSRAFDELRAVCAADAGRLWGRSVCGPIVFVEPRTREAMTESGPATMPDTIGIANTAVDWNGGRWTMVMWPLPSSIVDRQVLLAHESFHRIQGDLGLPASSPSNAHLDSAEARTWMRLEWRALARALASRDARDVADALAFREKRRAVSRAAAEEERLLELNEGLAEYTGYALAVPHWRERIAPLVNRLASADHTENMARAFAYVSGPAWGTLIEMRQSGWTRRIDAAADLGEIARHAWDLSHARQLREERYDGAAVRADEAARAERKRKLLAELTARFVEGPVLVLPLEKMSFTFDPSRVQPLGEHGSIYRHIEVRDAWGKLVAEEGALISADFKRLIVPASPTAYELTLDQAWQMGEGARPGDRAVTRR